MRTSLDLNDSLFSEAKLIAAEQHTSLKAVVEDGLRFLIAARRNTAPATPADWPICTQALPVAGVDLTSNSALYDTSESP